MVGEAADKRAMCFQILLRVQARGVAAAFGGWLHGAGTLRRHRYLLGKSHRRHTRATLSSVLTVGRCKLTPGRPRVDRAWF